MNTITFLDWNEKGARTKAAFYMSNAKGSRGRQLIIVISFSPLLTRQG